MKYTDGYWDDIERVLQYIPNITRIFGKSILITGATGMICSCVADMIIYLNKSRAAGIDLYLAGRNKERMAERFYNFVEDEDYYFVQFDATSSMTIDAMTDYVIYGAGNADPILYAKQPVQTMLGNIMGLNTILKEAVKRASKRVIYISSSEVYGNKTENRPYIEDDFGVVDILNPRACYPSAKRAAETLCVSYTDEYGLETVMARPGHIYGPTIRRSDSRASSQFTWNVIDGKDIVMKSSGSQMRSYCYTMDCASAILTILINGENKNAYNISNKDSIVSIRNFAEALADYGRRKIVFENSSDRERKGYNLMNNSSLNAEKLESLGWRASFNLQEGIKRTIDYLG